MTRSARCAALRVVTAEDVTAEDVTAEDVTSEIVTSATRCAGRRGHGDRPAARRQRKGGKKAPAQRPTPPGAAPRRAGPG